LVKSWSFENRTQKIKNIVQEYLGSRFWGVMKMALVWKGFFIIIIISGVGKFRDMKIRIFI
jgi:hypothetical protein